MISKKKLAKFDVVVVGGCGHVGLPLAVLLANCGLSVVSYDLNEKTVADVNDATMPFLEAGLENILKKTIANKSFFATFDPKFIANAKFVIVVIGTPIDEHYNPEPNAVLNSLQDFVEYLNEDQLIILRSTVYPGVTSKIENFLGEKGIGSRVVFAPERIAEGAAVEELTKLPQLIGARSDEDFQLASNLFAKLGVKSIHISPEEAELAKLLTNVWRYIKFAAANEFYTLCSQNGLSYEKIRQAMVLDYPRASDLPKAGFSAGPCLVKDTATLKTFSGNKLPLGSAALEVNEGLAHFFVNKLRKIHNLEKETIGILGMSFKPEIDDIRSSLTFKLNKALSFHSKKVYMTDPYVVDKRNLNLEWVIENSSILIVATQHKVYENLKTDKPIYIVGKE